MAAPTAIPHAEASVHHHHYSHQDAAATVATAGSSSSTATLTAPSLSSNGLSRSPTNTSPPKHMVSPIYTQAGRSAFSLPGPNSASTSPTTTTWYSAGFASGNSQRVRSPTGPLQSGGGNAAAGPISSAVAPQRDSFPDAVHPSHLRSASFGSASSSLSSADLSNEPTTPRNELSQPPFSAGSLGRSNSTAGTLPPLGSSYEQIKKRRDSWSFANAGPGNRWSGLASLRERTQAAANGGAGTPYVSESAPPSAAAMGDGTAGPMGGLLRKWSISGGQPLKSPMQQATISQAQVAAPPPPPPPAMPARPTEEAPLKPLMRGRQASLGGGASGQPPKRRPSPMGERLLMGHFNAH